MKIFTPNLATQALISLA